MNVAFVAFLAIGVAATCATPEAKTIVSPAFGAGEKVFAANCAGCHGATGTGQPGIFPSLAANPYVAGDPKRVIHTVKFGLNGKIVAKGTAYDGVMPPWQGTLTDGQIADVITFVRASWGNHASAVTAARVKATRK